MSSSEDDIEEAYVIPRHLLRERKTWQRAYQEEIEALYASYLELGRETFGRAFHQLGTVSEFADFVFKYTQPGATKSNYHSGDCYECPQRG